MRQHGLDAAGAGLETFEAQQRVEPDQAPARAVQPVDLEGERIVGVALEPVGDEQHDRALGEHAARPQLVEDMQRRGDPRAAGPVRHARRAGRQRIVGIALAQRARDVGQPRAEQKRADAFSRVGEVMQEMQKDAAVLAHRAGNIEQRHDRRRLGLRPDEAQVDEIAAAFHAGAQGAADVDQMAARMRRQPPRAYFGERQHQPLHRLLGGGDLGVRHLREIFLLQHFAVGHRHAGVELDLALFLQLVVEAGEQCLMHARGAGLRAAAAAPTAPAASSSPTADRYSRGGGRKCETPDRTAPNARAASRTPRAASSKNHRACRRRRPSPLRAHRALRRARPECRRRAARGRSRRCFRRGGRTAPSPQRGRDGLRAFPAIGHGAGALPHPGQRTERAMTSPARLAHWRGQLTPPPANPTSPRRAFP